MQHKLNDEDLATLRGLASDLGGNICSYGNQRKCLAVDGVKDYCTLLFYIGKSGKLADFFEQYGLIDNTEIDSMGPGTVVYWPSIEAPEEKAINK